MAKPSKNIFLLGWVSLFTDLSSQMIYPLLPSFLVQLGASTTIIGMIEGIAEASASIFKSIFGKWSDKIKNRKLFIFLGYGISTVAKPFLFFAGHWSHVLGIKYAERMGKAARTPARDALLASSTSKGSRGRDFGIQRSMDKIGSVGGPMLALFILYLAPENYRLVFLLAVIPAAIALTFIPFVKEQSWLSYKFENASTPRVLNSRPFKIFLATNIIFSLGNSSNAFLLLKASEVGVDTLSLPLLWIIYNAVAAISAPLFGQLSDTMGRKPVILASFAFYALLYVGFAFTGTKLWVFVLFGMYGIYYGLSQGVYKAFIADLTVDQNRAAAYGIFDMSVGLALLPASLIMGLIWDGIGSRAAFLSATGFSAIAFSIFLFSFVIQRRTR